MNLSRERTAWGGICRAGWNSHLENSCNSKSNTFLWRWLGFQLITSLESLNCLREVSRPPREMMANCTRYVCKDNPDPQPPHNCNHIAKLNSVLILEIRLESCRFYEKGHEKGENRLPEGVSLAFAYSLPHAMFLLHIVPNDHPTPWSSYCPLCYITLPQQCCNQAELASLSHLKLHVIHTQSTIA